MFPFTDLNIAVALIASTVLPSLRNASFLSSLFVLVSFHVAGVVDPTVYVRMRATRRWTACFFHVGNVIVHVAPAIAMANTSGSIGASDALIAHAIFLAWLIVAPPMDEVYVPMSTRAWTISIASGVVAQLAWIVASSQI